MLVLNVYIIVIRILINQACMHVYASCKASVNPQSVRYYYIFIPESWQNADGL